MLKLNVFCLVYHLMASLRLFNGVVLRATSGKFFYMLISAAITENFVLFNIFAHFHDNVSRMMSIPRFSWSRSKMKAFIKLSH